MLEFIHLIRITLETNEWFLFEIYVIFVWIAMLPRMFCAGIFFLKKEKKIRNITTKHSVTVIITIYKEELDILEKCMRGVKESLIYSCSNYAFLAIIDGCDRDNKEENNRQYKIACRYADVVLGTNARNKRKNIYQLIQYAKKNNLLNELTIFLDSDVILQDKSTIEKLLAPFSNAKVGGVTTAQLIYQPQTLMQKISFWLEDARLKSSMAATSLFHQVPCLPGRMYAARTHLFEHKMHELVNDTFSYFGLLKRNCIAGDDRAITNFILCAGYRTELALDAVVYTLAPKSFIKTCKMWARWGRSSQGYTLRSPWLIRYPFAFFVCWTDILISLFTVFILAVHWPYKIITGDVDVVLLQSLVLSFLGMMMTVSFRQLPHLVKYPRDYWLLPLFSIIVTYAQFIRVWALLTPHLIGTWGTREGADSTAKNDDVQLLWQHERYTFEHHTPISKKRRSKEETVV